jgi:hypothetical protein
MKTDTQQVFL